MREVTPNEARAWTELAEEHEATDSHGSIATGRFVTHRLGPDVLELELVTPLVSGEISEQLERKQPPVMFDRTTTGELVIPLGRWIRDAFERLAEDDETPDDVAYSAHVAAHGGVNMPATVLLPADTDTIAFQLPDEDGEMITHEALPPGGRIRLTVRGEETEES